MPWAGGFGFFCTPRKAGCRSLHPVMVEGGGWESWRELPPLLRSFHLQRPLCSARFLDSRNLGLLLAELLALRSPVAEGDE